MSKIAFTLTAALFAIAAGQSSQFDSSGSAEFRDPDTDLTEDRSAGDVSPSMGKKGKKGKTASDDQEGLNRIGDEITVGKGKGKSMGKGKSGTGGPDAIDRIGDGGTLLAKSAKGKSSKSDADAGDGGVLDRGGSGDIGGSGDRGVSGSGADKIVSIVQTTAASSPSGKKTGKSSGKKKSFKSVGSLRAATATTAGSRPATNGIIAGAIAMVVGVALLAFRRRRLSAGYTIAQKDAAAVDAPTESTPLM